MDRGTIAEYGATQRSAAAAKTTVGTAAESAPCARVGPLGATGGRGSAAPSKAAIPTTQVNIRVKTGATTTAESAISTVSRAATATAAIDSPDNLADPRTLFKRRDQWKAVTPTSGTDN